MGIDIEACYRRYGPMVIRRCRRLLGNEEEAVDAAQDTFVRLLLGKKRLRSTGLSSLLFRIATNLCLNRIRDRKHRRCTADDDLLSRIADAGEPESRLGARLRLDRLFSHEPESTRTIAVLHLVDGMTLEEVAGAVGMSVSGVRKRLRRLRAHLSELEGV